MKEMSLIVRNVASWLVIPALVFGMYVILHGHLTPGGGFAGGSVMATLTALLIVAFGHGSIERARLKKNLLFLLESIGLVAFALLAFFGLGKTFFNNFLLGTWLFGNVACFGPNAGYLLTAGVLPLMNIAVGFEVFAALSLVVLALASWGEK